MKTIKYLVITILAMSVLSCSNEEFDSANTKTDDNEKKVKLSNEEVISILYDNTKVLSEKEVLEILSNFEESNETSLRSYSKKSYSIKNMYYVNADQNNGTFLRSESINNSMLHSLPIYEIEIGTDEGIAYVSADARYPNVIAYIPIKAGDKEITGKDLLLSYSEETALRHIETIELIKDSLRTSTLQKLSDELMLNIDEINIESIKELVEVEYEDEMITTEVSLRASPVVNPPNTMSQRGPFAAVTWSQREPYNRKLPTLPYFDEMHFAAGCGVIAGATILSIVEPNMLISSINMNWAYLKQKPTIIEPSYGGWAGIPDNKDKLDMVAYLIRDIYYGTYTSTSFEKDPYMGESSTSATNLINYLRKYINIDNYQNMNLDNQLSSLNYSRPILMGGISNAGTAEKGSHAWVIDGYRLCKKMNRQLVQVYDVYFHANMGWAGTDDGYYLVGSNLSLTFKTELGEYNSNLWQMCHARKK